MVAFCRPHLVAALALCTAAIAVTVSPASARPHHGAGRHARAYLAGHHARWHHVRYQRHHYQNFARQSGSERGVEQMRTRGLADSYAGIVPNTGGVTFENSAPSGSGLVAEARRYLGGNPTDRRSLWCARFMNMVLQHTGHRGTGSDMASSFASYGTRVSGPQVGAIAVMTRGRSGGHVGIITGVDASGNPIMISGNNGNRVREAPVSRGRIYAYVMPN
jgi:uncharacterized protein (TIGR02594 family)